MVLRNSQYAHFVRNLYPIGPISIDDIGSAACTMWPGSKETSKNTFESSAEGSSFAWQPSPAVCLGSIRRKLKITFISDDFVLWSLVRAGN
jgi:hypothetical protein